MKNLWRIVWWGKERHRTSKICYNYWQQHLPCWSEGAPLPVVMTGGASPGKLYHRAGNDPPEGYTLKATQPLFSFSLFWGQRRCDRPAWVPWAKICAQLMNLLKFIQICFDYTKAFNCVITTNMENSSRDGNIRPPDLPPEKSVCRSRSNS